MSSLTNNSIALFVFSFVALSLFAWLGTTRFRALRARLALSDEDFKVVEGATLTLLGLIIGFTFSMALTRYDQRKNLEEEEANAIGTEYLRADLLLPADATRIKDLLQQYTDERLKFYTSHDGDELERINAATGRLQAQMWTAVQAPALAQPTPVAALAVSGMNDVINSQGYTQAAWLNRIPQGAWFLVLVLSMGSAAMVGVGAKATRPTSEVQFVFPLVVAIALFLIADIDGPRGGMIRVSPVNLILFAQSLRAN
jgi:hypothetical protein